MKDLNRKGIREDSPTGGRRQLWAAVAFVVACCGGGNRLLVTGDAGAHEDGGLGSGGVGGGVWGVGGAAAGTGGRSAPASGGVAGGDARRDAVSQAGDDGPWKDGSVGDGGSPSPVDGGLCAGDWKCLWEQIKGGAGQLYCGLVVVDGGIGWRRVSKVVFDGEGRIVENTGIDDPAAREAWLAKLANDRWPSLAGQELLYECSSV